MATKLKNLKITKVDFVDEGANPDAHIRMVKSKDGKELPVEMGGRYIGVAPDFVIQGSGGQSEKEPKGILKKLFDFIGKAAGMDQGEIDSAMDEIQKGDSVSFNEKINEISNRKIADEIWDICYALQSSLCSILNDEELDSTQAATAMQESLDEFYAIVKESVTNWSSGRAASIVKKNEEVSDTELEIMKSAVERLNESIEKAAMDAIAKKGSDNNENPKGDEEEMKIDKSKLTEAERAFLESLEKRYGMNDGDDPGAGGPTATQAFAGQAHTSVPGAPPVAKSVSTPAAETEFVQLAEVPEDIYKGLHPAVRAELEGLKKFREEAETRELTEIAKKYAIIGKKEEELVPLLKSLKAAGGTAYSDMIAVLDQAVATVEKSGAFSEIGKSGHGSGTVGAAEAKVEAIAKGYMEKDASLDYASAMAKAWEDNPELMAEYEAEAGF